MDAATPLPSFYLIAVSAMFGASIAAFSIALFTTRHCAWDWIYARATRALMQDSMKQTGQVPEFRPRRSR